MLYQTAVVPVDACIALIHMSGYIDVRSLCLTCSIRTAVLGR